MNRPIALVTLGEAMLRFSPPNHERLEQATCFDVHIGGSELNTAAAAVCVGLPARFVTRLPRNPLGRMVERKAREHGVDVSCIAWTDEDRVGTYYLEFGAAPRANSVVYDRRQSAIARISKGEIDWTAAFAGATAFHTSGITPALSPSAAEATLEAVAEAKSAGLLVSIDLNYRERLWSEAEARRVMTDIVRSADVLITTEEDTQRVFGIERDSYEDVARTLVETYGLKVVAITLRENLSVWRNRWTAIAYEAATDEVHRAPVFDIEVVDRVGSGDAFVGGFLRGYLDGDVASGVLHGVGISAIKQTHPGDVVYTTPGEIERVLAGGGGLRIVR
jgi:2-dehydro-3-deoxygluconokinase